MATETDEELLALTDLVDRLIDLLDHETGLVRDGFVEAIAGIQDEKQRLGAAVRQGGAVFAQAGGVDRRAAQPEDAADFADAVTALNAASAANEHALRGAMRATNRVIQAMVAGAAGSDPGRDPRYTSAGRLIGRRRAAPPRPGVDKSL